MRVVLRYLLYGLLWSGFDLRQSTADYRTTVTSTSYGRVKGVVVGDGSERLYKYTGIPFAKPPTGELRFKPPQPPEAWNTTLDATTTPPDCPQYIPSELQQILHIRMNLSEDCLYLNVYTPSVADGAMSLPVMVWIYGGAFVGGSSSTYDGSTLARKGVVVVTLNYRIDALGFLSTEDDALPGNYGLLDQISALRWTQKNVGSFGGDPGRVTLFGESAGACSVSLLSVSPLAKGLFHRAIIQSGSLLTPWAVTYPSTSVAPRKLAELIGAKVNCTLEDSTQFVACLRGVKFMDLLDASTEVQEVQPFRMVLLPRIERTFGVIPDLPRKLLALGGFEHIDTIRGFNNNEAVALKQNLSAWMTKDEFKNVIKSKLARFTFRDLDGVVRLFEDVYLGHISDPALTLEQASAALTDFSFAAPTLIEAKMASEISPDRKHYVYDYNYRSSISDLPPWATAQHADEVPFVFGSFALPLWRGVHAPSQEDVRVSEQLMTLWTNFAKTGDPTVTTPAGAVEWRPSSSSQPRMLMINKVSELTGSGRQEAVELYGKLLPLIETSPVGVVVGK
ncbi:unnamed protein product [Lymnaea stagnalis]|uniref:Carboxylic ester hydrolase n=1 Tax=Lymnaea stagnalis TaxID=6523 RepID=A0AAV2HIB7_LYMST